MKIVSIIVFFFVLVSFPTSIFSSEWEAIVDSNKKRERPIKTIVNPNNKRDRPVIGSEAFLSRGTEQQFDMHHTLDAFIKEAKSKYRSMPPGDFAKWLTARVDNHVQAINLDMPKEKGSSGNEGSFLELRKDAYKSFFDHGDICGLDTAYSSAYWTWGSKMGHCDQHAKTIYHILTMVTGRNDNFCILQVLEDVGHAYVVWDTSDTSEGIKKLIQNRPISWKSVKALNDVWILDPWSGVSKKASEVSGSGLEKYITGSPGVEISIPSHNPYDIYIRQLEKYLSPCNTLKGKKWDIGIPNKDYLTVTGIEYGNSRKSKWKLGDKIYCKKKDHEGKVHRLEFKEKVTLNNFCASDFCWLDRGNHYWHKGRAMSVVTEKFNNIRNKTKCVHIDILSTNGPNIPDKTHGFISTMKQSEESGGKEGVWVRLTRTDPWTDATLTLEGFLTLPNGFPF